MKYFGKTAYKGDIASNYEKDRIVESIWQKEQDWVSDFLKNIAANSKILDLPVGSGRFLEFYANKQVEAFGFDISADMIEVSKIKLKELGDNKSITLAVSDAENIDLQDKAVDYVFCFRLFHLIPFNVIKKIIKEFYRVTENQVIIEIFDSSFAADQKVSLSGQLKKALSSVKRKLSSAKNKPLGNATPWGHIVNYSYSYNALVNEFKKAGFKNITIDKIADTGNPVTIFILSK